MEMSSVYACDSHRIILCSLQIASPWQKCEEDTQVDSFQLSEMLGGGGGGGGGAGVFGGNPPPPPPPPPPVDRTLEDYMAKQT